MKEELHAKIKEAIKSRFLVELEYEDKEGVITKRTVAPYVFGIIKVDETDVKPTKGGYAESYLNFQSKFIKNELIQCTQMDGQTKYVNDGSDIRKFLVNKIISLKLTEESFTPKYEPDYMSIDFDEVYCVI